MMFHTCHDVYNVLWSILFNLYFCTSSISHAEHAFQCSCKHRQTDRQTNLGFVDVSFLINDTISTISYLGLMMLCLHSHPYSMQAIRTIITRLSLQWWCSLSSDDVASKKWKKRGKKISVCNWLRPGYKRIRKKGGFFHVGDNRSHLSGVVNVCRDKIVSVFLPRSSARHLLFYFLFAVRAAASIDR